MLIGICDDEVVIRNEVVRLIDKYKTSNMDNIETISFSSGDGLLLCNRQIDILFLDIQMKGLNGIKTAEKIRENDDSMIIILLTGYKGFLQVGYKVRAFRYLLKPINEKEFNQTLTEAMNDITKNYKAIVDLEGGTIFIKPRDIIYIEYNNRCTIVRTKKDVYESSISMNEWVNILNTGDFFRVHKAYIVNMANIEEIAKEILLDNGEKVELSIRQSGKLKRACKDFRKRNAR